MQIHDFNLNLYLFHEDYIQPEATSISPRYNCKQQLFGRSLDTIYEHYNILKSIYISYTMVQLFNVFTYSYYRKEECPQGEKNTNFMTCHTVFCVWYLPKFKIANTRF
jgi:hypothetical protein